MRSVKQTAKQKYGGSEWGSNPPWTLEVPKRTPPSLSRQEVELPIDKAGNARDRAIVSLFTESGLRLSELANVRLKDIDGATTP